MILEVPAEGVGALPQPGVVPKLSRTPGRVTHAASSLGRHTDEILSGLLGMSADEISALRAEGDDHAPERARCSPRAAENDSSGF